MTGPLSGRTLLVTREGGLADGLRALGAEVRVAEVTRFVRVPAAADPAGYDWIVYTSARAVAYCPLPPGAGPRVACVGPATAGEVEARGGRVDFVPRGAGAGALCEELLARVPLAGARVLFPCSDRSLDVVPERLGAAGARVTRLVVYRTEPAAALTAGIADGVDAIVWLAPSAVEAFAALGGDPAAAPAVALGETTAAALRARGIEPVVAPSPDREGVVSALRARWESRP